MRNASGMEQTMDNLGSGGTDSLRNEGNGSFSAEAQNDTQKNQASKTSAPTVLGEIVWLMSRSAAHKHYAITDLEWMVIPAIRLEQFRLFRDESGRPIAAVMWANLSEEAEVKLESGKGRLRPDEWNGGDQPWIINVIAPDSTPENKLVSRLLSELKSRLFMDKAIKILGTNTKTGHREGAEIKIVPTGMVAESS